MCASEREGGGLSVFWVGFAWVGIGGAGDVGLVDRLLSCVFGFDDYGLVVFLLLRWLVVGWLGLKGLALLFMGFDRYGLRVLLGRLHTRGAVIFIDSIHPSAVVSINRYG